MKAIIKTKQKKGGGINVKFPVSLSLISANLLDSNVTWVRLLRMSNLLLWIKDFWLFRFD